MRLTTCDDIDSVIMASERIELMERCSFSCRSVLDLIFIRRMEEFMKNVFPHER